MKRVRARDLRLRQVHSNRVRTNTVRTRMTPTSNPLQGFRHRTRPSYVDRIQSMKNETKADAPDIVSLQGPGCEKSERSRTVDSRGCFSRAHFRDFTLSSCHSTSDNL